MKKAIAFILIACALFSASGAQARRLRLERRYQMEWCSKAGGVAEYTLSDRTRVDCVTEEYAVEVDFASKWAGAVAQAVYYSIATGKRPGILLIMEEKSDERFLERLRTVTDKLGIRLWTVTPEGG